MWPADLLRYSLWIAVAATAARNRKEYGVPTAWLTHLAVNTMTLFLPDFLRLVRVPPRSAQYPDSTLHALLRMLDRRTRLDPNYAAYTAPLAAGFILSHPDFSIYHGRWAERQILGFGVDSVPHAAAAYTLARLVSESLLSLNEELPSGAPLAGPVNLAVEHVDLAALLAVAVVTLIWELSEYIAHVSELKVTGRDPSEINMQWSLPDTITDTISNLLGWTAAVAVRRRNRSLPTLETLPGDVPA